ncbi:MAG: penicillin-binding protein [Prevotella sp.]|nr:penicillin-binding protein [Prevotella sp.]
MKKRYFVAFAILILNLSHLAARPLGGGGVAVPSKPLPALTTRPLLQQLAARLLKGKQGSIVALNPKNGEVVCLASNAPNGNSYLPAIAKAYEPGSTFKTAQALAMLAEGLITPDTEIACEGFFLDGNIRVGCHGHRSPLNLTEALAQSCNTWFISNFMAMLGDDFLYESPEEAVNTWNAYMRSMGLGGPLGIDLQGEKGGLVANTNYLTRRYKDGWTPKTILWTAMGMGDITMTPLQMANLAATIANRGFFYKPHINRDTPQSPLPNKYKVKHQTTIPSELYAPVVEGMRMAVEHGTCHAIKAPYPICGKTGTIENKGGRDHSAFIGFAPADEPKVAIAVYIEHGGFGADLAAPVAALIMETYLKGKLSASSEAKARKIENTRTMM